MLNTLESFQFSLSNFRGSLDLLLHLIHREEIDVFSIPLKNVLVQLVDHLTLDFQVDKGADALARLSGLLLLKSRKLLPNQNLEEEEDPQEIRFQLIQQLLEYAQFKEVAHSLIEREMHQQAFFPRGTVLQEKTVTSGIENVTLQELAQLMQELVKLQTAKPSVTVQDEEWHVLPKIEWLRMQLSQDDMDFYTLFSPLKSRNELIVLFLALLEMIKNREATVFHTPPNSLIIRRYHV